MTLPNPFISADQHPLSAETAAAESQPRATAAEVLPDPPSNEGRHQGAPESVDWNSADAGATDHIHEIFHHARKLCDEGDRFVLDVPKFMFDIGYVPPAARPENFAKYMAVLDALIDDDPPPLFLQRAV